MVDLYQLVGDLDALLDPERMEDYGPNGVQVEGRADIEKVVSAVTASQNVIDHAVEMGADALLVHHGIFWNRGTAPTLTGWLGRRVRTLIKNDISLIAYHLPLDAHEGLGNNRRLLEGLGLEPAARFGKGDLGMLAHCAPDASAKELVRRLSSHVGQAPVHIAGGTDAVRTVGVVSGAGQRYFEEAIDAGCDLFITGEASEFVTHVARESGVHYVWAGHHATEKGGVQALGAHLEKTYGIDVSFFDDPNPV